MSIGVPIKVLHEAEGHIVTCETSTGEVYRGKLIEAEDNMNCQFSNITVTHRDGRSSQLENVYIRGSKIRFLILPDMLKNAPMFKRVQGRGGGAGRGKSAIFESSSCQRSRSGWKRRKRVPEEALGVPEEALDGVVWWWHYLPLGTFHFAWGFRQHRSQVVALQDPSLIVMFSCWNILKTGTFFFFFFKLQF
eukprot:TRINITY_DN95755_c0_g1_i2.p1 TRINITY_DN95755_c0_g1~~TRINITY_DN95755_c0_g1_i2.p1  ORF type:complete len:192 (+),score=22.76 TRINITY_DN95755_c0_g1_i2:158-733(+)